MTDKIRNMQFVYYLKWPENVIGRRPYKDGGSWTPDQTATINLTL